MDEHEHYMQDFMRVFSTLERWGPGSDSDTAKALAAIPHPVQHILEIGCGKGSATRILAQSSQASIIALDSEMQALKALASQCVREQPHKITPIQGDMSRLPFQPGRFDLIWAEGCAYIMGVPQALKQWRPLLTERGILVFSDLVWLTHKPAAGAKHFWQQGYPGMTHLTTREEQIQQTGYRLLDSFNLSEASWQNYIDPLQQRLSELHDYRNTEAWQDIAAELEIYRHHSHDFAYRVFVMERTTM